MDFFKQRPNSLREDQISTSKRGCFLGQMYASTRQTVNQGWAYYLGTSLVRYVLQVDSAVFDCLWRWARRRHRNKSSRWIYRKYFQRLDGCRVFRERARGEDGKPRITKLFRAGSLPIIRHVKIIGDANPYDPRWEAYFERRLDLKMETSPKRRQQLLRLWISQGGVCTECGYKITRMTGWRSHKIIWRVFGGSDSMSNRILLHPRCHSRVHDRELKVVKPRLVKEALREA